MAYFEFLLIEAAFGVNDAGLRIGELEGFVAAGTREEDVITTLFVASTHTPLLFFSSRGVCYRMKVWRLPASTPQAVGKALVNLLPLAQGEVITSVLPLPEDAETWGTLQLAFATRSGKVRRNATRLQYENDALGDGLLFAG